MRGLRISSTLLTTAAFALRSASGEKLRNIPLFFRYATTFSSLPSNQSYRRLVSTLLAPLSGNLWIAGAAAAWYGLPPANADTVNYIIASSEVISTLGVVAFVVLLLGL